MRVILGRAEDNTLAVRRFREQLCGERRLVGEFRAVDPLPYAFYLFAVDGAAAPVGMAEFFFYDQAFDHYRECSYPQAFHIARLAPMDQAVHVRSLVVADHPRQDALSRLLCESVLCLASKLGARFLTADTETGLAELRALAPSAPSSGSGRGSCDGVLSLAPWEADAAHAVATKLDAGSIDLLSAQTIRRRGQRAPILQTRACPGLDRLLPAHWVGVWQRQLRVFVMPCANVSMR